MYFGNIGVGTGHEDRVKCVTIRMPGDMFPVFSGMVCWTENHSEVTNSSAWVSLPNFDILQLGTPNLPS